MKPAWWRKAVEAHWKSAAGLFRVEWFLSRQAALGPSPTFTKGGFGSIAVCRDGLSSAQKRTVILGLLPALSV